MYIVTSLTLIPLSNSIVFILALNHQDRRQRQPAKPLISARFSLLHPVIEDQGSCFVFKDLVAGPIQQFCSGILASSSGRCGAHW